ncbi:MAG: DUF523 domain-containing protein [Clostridium sp.]|uniref:DUF523 domain-containing protein n=1 Tax=Clostridium sp. TaxID=1506 RepID=UPI003F2F303B
MILVSACLVGVDCKYNGKNNLNKNVINFLKGKEYMIVCPEQLGGLTTPRIPAEIRGEKILDKNFKDVTTEFLKGAKETEKIATLVGAKMAILKEGSPSCGVKKVYDGTFTGKKIKGKGITARLLEEKGLKIVSEEEIK